MIYDFYEGKLSELLKKLTVVEVKKNSNYFFEPIENIPYFKIKKEGKRFFYEKGEDAYMMFSYKYQTFIIDNDNRLPRFHVCNCKTMKEYSGFVFASKMPVKVYCRNRKAELPELQYLSLCGNCIKESQKKFYKFLAKGKPWYDYVLEYANSGAEIATKVKSDGYVIMWRQISEAVREKASFCCERCKIDLKKRKYNLEVHHIDYDKKNNQFNNLSSMCVLCHATIDDMHLSNFKSNPLKVNNFIDNNLSYIEKHNMKSLNVWSRK